jgi:large subunit ribosomal protein L17
MGPTADAEVKPGDKDDADHRTIVQKLFSDIGPRFADRPGGYTRILKRHERRLGDAGRTAYLELLKEGETKRVRTPPPAPAPAPQVEEQPAPPEQPQAGEQTQAPQGEQNPPA